MDGVAVIRAIKELNRRWCSSSQLAKATMFAGSSSRAWASHTPHQPYDTGKLLQTLHEALAATTKLKICPGEWTCLAPEYQRASDLERSLHLKILDQERPLVGRFLNDFRGRLAGARGRRAFQFESDGRGP